MGSKPAYQNPRPAGYSVAMLVEASETLLSPATLLWLAVSVAAAAILFGAMNRRRSRLTDSLRDYVDREQGGKEASPRSEDGSQD